MNKFKAILVAVLAIMFVMFASGCSTVSTQPDENALHYEGGSFSSSKFENCVKPSSRNFDGPGDDHYIYPAGQRTFSFTGADGSESGPISVTTGSQEVLIPGFVTFTLTSDCESLRKFHETVGKKYEAYKDGRDGHGWNEFINDYIAVPLSSTLNKAATSIETPEGATKDQNWFLLYNDGETQRAFETFVKENLPDEIEATLGADYITVNAVSIAKPQISDDLKNSLAAKEKARLDNEAQRERNEQVRTQFDTIKDCLATGLNESSCTLIYLSQSGADIPFLPVPQGGAVNYNR